MSVTVPIYTGNTAGNIRSSSSLGNGANATYDLDAYSSKFEIQINVTNTPGGTIAGTAGLRIEVFRRYGATPTVAASPCLSFTLPSANTNTAEAKDFVLGPGKYRIKVTNLDATNAVTVEITADTIDNLTTT